MEETKLIELRFGLVPSRKRSTSVSLPGQVLDKLNFLAAKGGQSKSEIMTEALVDYFKRLEEMEASHAPS